MGIATDLIFIVIAALLAGLAAHILRQPLIFGYIFAGVAVGPYTGGVTVENIHDIEMLAEIGVALLLFALGLEFSFGELKRLSRITFIGAPIQIVMSAAAGFSIAEFLGFSRSDAIWIGAAISLSSTMVVLKTLDVRNALETTAGRLMLAILIAQDLAVIPLMLILPQLTGDAIHFGEIFAASAKSAAFLAVMYLAGTRLLPKLFSLIAAQGSRELFFLATLGFAFGAGFVSEVFGLSFALGAFIAGMLLSETDFNHQALSDVSALRDLFALIFFASVGMLFDPQFFMAHLATILALTFALIACKAIVTATTVRLLGYERRVALIVGLGLSQVGEFAFVIFKAGSSNGSLTPDSFSLMIAVTVVSMIATPGLYWMGLKFSEIFPERAISDTGETIAKDLADHVIIIGGGMVGQYVARVLMALERPYVIIETDHKTVTQMRDQGMAVIFGDGSHRTILEAAHVSSARLVVLSTTNDKILPLIIAEIRESHLDLPIVVRVEEIDDLQALSALKVDQIVQPQLEVGLEIVRRSLLALGISESEILTVLGQLRSQRYQPESVGGIPTADGRLMRAARMLEFSWFEVKNSCPYLRKTLEGAKMREQFGISIVAVVRGEEFIATPKPTFEMQSGDILGVLGTRTQLEALKAVF